MVEVVPGARPSQGIGPPRSVYLYVVGSAGSDPARIECPVPWPVDSTEIFFGACKKRIREDLRRRFLSNRTNDQEVIDDIWLVGVYPAHDAKPRNLVFAGRLRRVMTFGRAYDALTHRRYESMRRVRTSPLHVQPLYRDDALVGYQHRGQMHAKSDAWVLDLVQEKKSPFVRQEGERLLINPDVTPWLAFPRDATFLLESVFWSPTGEPIQLDGEVAEVLRAAQPSTTGVTARAPFGTNVRGDRNGLRGSYLLLTGGPATAVTDWIIRRRREVGSRHLPPGRA